MDHAGVILLGLREDVGQIGLFGQNGVGEAEYLFTGIGQRKGRFPVRVMC
ncbi:MAG: hypothetical protein PUB12_10820 [[Clostridium] aminophilum]|nr:hypothetical protein [[Clostridium] aminophilum]MDD6197353.1 hypothetical protein [[Clostridium] aminophilum]